MFNHTQAWISLVIKKMSKKHHFHLARSHHFVEVPAVAGDGGPLPHKAVLSGSTAGSSSAW